MLIIDKKFHNKDNKVQHELKMANFEAFRQAQNSFFRGVWGLRPNFVENTVVDSKQSQTILYYFKEGGGDYGT